MLAELAQIQAQAPSMTVWAAALAFVGGIAVKEFVVRTLWPKKEKADNNNDEFSAGLQLKLQQIVRTTFIDCVLPILSNQTDILKGIAQTNQAIRESIQELATIERNRTV
jgi:hypothetical protein